MRPCFTRALEVRFGYIDCRKGGAENVVCIQEKVKRFPTIMFYSGVSGDVTRINNNEALLVINDIDSSLEDDRRRLNSPFQGGEELEFTYHDEL